MHSIRDQVAHSSHRFGYSVFGTDYLPHLEGILFERWMPDSLDRFQLLLKAQEEFCIVISEMEAMEVYSVADAITLIEQKMLDNQQKTS